MNGHNPLSVMGSFLGWYLPSDQYRDHCTLSPKFCDYQHISDWVPSVMAS